ncbi:neprilysin-2 isoform X3 [Eurytemora carolleeae]|uniref:neprilysin-2 isoform X3 n=1 Tax=Eurytemora carolleeae TaxID=1294199 RepID=UPI000C78FE40|nr:neprilysin-2 isoform X3 [Eurytemora carolleeae]|eukprot:XP_023346897.1 neprilysin-2-like isoform X3 [Eurytemora affinis]
MSLPREERRNATALNNQMTLEEGNKMYPAFNWTNHVRNILDNPEVPINSSEVINVAVPVYVQKLAVYMPSVPARVQANYLLWRFIKGMVSFSDKEARQIQLKYNMVLTGKEQESPRWETCVKTTSGNGENYLYFYEGSLTNAVGAMYAKEYFPESSKQIADDMVSNIKKEFKTMLDELDWMDDITRKKAHSKVDKMMPFIGYAKEILDDKLINEHYKGLDLNSPSYLKNFLKLKTFINEYYVKVFRDPIDNHSWKTHGGAAIVNAFYSPNENSIQFPAGILDGVFFKDDRPSYMNYGAIGVVVGHEITHGFDDTGSQKDGDGNLVDWWEPQTKKKYLERAQCIIDQYSNFTVEVVGEILNVNGINTQGENIADNGGYKEAYRAYEKLTKEQGEELSLPGLPYTPRQLFWISGAAVWCNILREEALKNRVLTDPHAPGRYRVNGSYRNQKEFSKDWNCPKGSNMNPEKKCSVW